jgi:hypothetical protein
MMTGIRVQHRSESAFTFNRNGRSGWAGIRTHLDVGWLQVAMDDALLVGSFEGFGDLPRDRQRLVTALV